METYGTILNFEIQGTEALEDRGLKVCFVNTGKERIELIAPTREDSEVMNKDPEFTISALRSTISTKLSKRCERGARIVGDGVQSGAHDTR